MPQYRNTAPVFRNGVLHEIGSTLVAQSDPGAPWVLASAYDDSGGSRVERVEAPGFVLEIGGKLVKPATATRLAGRSLREGRY